MLAAPIAARTDDKMMSGFYSQNGVFVPIVACTRDNGTKSPFLPLLNKYKESLFAISKIGTGFQWSDLSNSCIHL